MSLPLGGWSVALLTFHTDPSGQQRASSCPKAVGRRVYKWSLPPSVPWTCSLSRLHLPTSNVPPIQESFCSLGVFYGQFLESTFPSCFLRSLGVGTHIGALADFISSTHSQLDGILYAWLTGGREEESCLWETVTLDVLTRGKCLTKNKITASNFFLWPWLFLVLCGY